jgi:hypothetical protein
LNAKHAFSELSFMSVTHTTYSDARFGSYGILNLGQGAEQIMDRLGMHVDDQVLRAEYV